MASGMKKRFFAQHAKSSAALVSLGIHAILILVAVSFVAVTVIQREEQKFETKPVKRPKMQLKRLQVPVNVKKKKPKKPKLRKRIVVQPKINQQTPDIKMPEISGVKGGLGSAGDGLGGAGSIGFNMPEMKLFGVKSRGEKVFIILDSGNKMMLDEMGGIRGYEIIKSELTRILGGLNSTVIFNVAVFSDDIITTAFPEMAPATPENVDKVVAWLKPLNSVEKAMSGNKYGISTLGSGGTKFEGDFKV
ncbi:MAG: hypothetical protein OES84_00950, partial [Kiritimatiellaceae bacterium]|nr:hypothetical protein [Kiritimatiellaceae bacterium]